MGALSLLFLVLLDPGDEILIQDPQWLNYVAQVRYCGGEPVRVPTDLEHNFEMQPETIERLITPHTKALMINSPNNPTGSVMSRAAMEQIAAIAKSTTCSSSPTRSITPCSTARSRTCPSRSCPA